MVYILRFFSSSKCSLFHNSNVFGSCIIHILYTGCAKIKNNSGAKRLTCGRIRITAERFFVSPNELPGQLMTKGRKMFSLILSMHRLM